MQVNAFTMDPNLLVSVIKSQAGTLSKALLEGIMNSVDAGASRIDVTITLERFIIEDNGKGFASEEEILNWFGRFGTPHVEGDAVFGRFRMGRGQMMAFAVTTWRSGLYSMEVDIENKGMSYALLTHETAYKGCRVEGVLYRPLADYRLRDLLTELRKFVAYMPKPVYVNGELFGASAARLKTWTFEDDDAWYKVVQDSEELLVYNQGAFVEEMGTWRLGMGGVVVSKQALKVNFARNSVMEDSCPVWRRIALKLEAVIVSKLSCAKKLSTGERKFLARRLELLKRFPHNVWMQVKVLTDPSGKHLPLKDLRNYRRFAYVAEQDAQACALHRENDTFVVTDMLLSRFGCDSLEAWLQKMRSLGGLVQDHIEMLSPEELRKQGLGSAQVLGREGLTRRERAALKTLAWLNDALVPKLQAAGVDARQRDILVGKHEHGNFVAWTDGKTYITANKRYLRLFDRGLNGVLEWLNTLVHEYMHDTDDSESHSHDVVFYRKFHDTLFGAHALSIGSLTVVGLRRHIEHMHEEGLGRPRELTRQLKTPQDSQGSQQ